MGRPALRSEHTARTLERHGEAGTVRLNTEVAPWVKDALIDVAERKRVTLKQVLNEALSSYLKDAA